MRVTLTNAKEYLQAVLDNCERAGGSRVAVVTRQGVGRQWRALRAVQKADGQQYARYVAWCRERGLDHHNHSNQADYQGW